MTRMVDLLKLFRDNPSMWFLEMKDQEFGILEEILIEFTAHYLKRRILVWNTTKQFLQICNGFKGILHFDFKSPPLSLEFNQRSEHYSSVKYKKSYKSLPLLLDTSIDDLMSVMPGTTLDKLLFEAYENVLKNGELNNPGITGSKNYL